MAGAIVAGLTGTGRFAIGKDPETVKGFFQLIDPDAADEAEAFQMSTFHQTTTDASTVAVNFANVVIEEDSATFVEIDIILRYADGSKTWAQKRTGLVSRNGSSNAVLEAEGAVSTHDPNTFPGSASFQVDTSRLWGKLIGVAATTIEWSGTIRWQAVTAAS